MSKKKTHEEYVNELAIKNPHIEVIDTYSGANTKIMHHCLIHDVYWYAQPSSMLRGSGCEQCRNDKIYASKRKTQEQYVKEVKAANPYVEVLGEYVNANTPILHRCLIHDIEWNAFPASILRGCGCVVCGLERSSRNSTKTHEQYIEELKGINPNVVPLEKYSGALTPIAHKCLLDGYEWMVTPANLLYGKGCPKCAGNAKKTHEEYIEEVALINPDIEVVGQYSGANTPILHKCKLDSNVWMARPDDILHGKGCPKCSESHGEKEVSKWLDEHGVVYESQKRFDDCRDDKPLPFDFYIPEYNVACEYQGKQHYEPVDFAGYGENVAVERFEYVQRHDKIKADYCKSNNIRLLCIPYYENTEEQLNNFLFI